MNLLKNILKSLPAILASILIAGGFVYAGTLTAPSGSPSAQSYTLSDIYNKLNANTSATAGNHDLSTTTTPAASFRSLTEIYNAIPAALSLSASSVTVPIGLNLSSFSLVSIDSDLVAAKIASSTVLFGITGTLYGDTDPAKVMTTALYPGTATGAAVPVTLAWSTTQGPNTWIIANGASGCGGTVDGSTGWRLPTNAELLQGISNQFILGLGDNGFVINSATSPQTVYWSSTDYIPLTGTASWYSYWSGYLQTSAAVNSNSTLRYRCVK